MRGGQSRPAECLATTMPPGARFCQVSTEMQELQRFASLPCSIRSGRCRCDVAKWQRENGPNVALKQLFKFIKCGLFSSASVAAQFPHAARSACVAKFPHMR